MAIDASRMGACAPHMDDERPQMSASDTARGGRRLCPVRARESIRYASRRPIEVTGKLTLTRAEAIARRVIADRCETEALGHHLFTCRSPELPFVSVF